MMFETIVVRQCGFKVMYVGMLSYLQRFYSMKYHRSDNLFPCGSTKENEMNTFIALSLDVACDGVPLAMLPQKYINFLFSNSIFAKKYYPGWPP